MLSKHFFSCLLFVFLTLASHLGRSQEGLSIGELKVVGVEKVNSFELLNFLSLRRGDNYSKELMHKSLEEMKAFYEQKAYYNVKVQTKLKKMSDGRVSIVYQIEENEQSELKKVELKFDIKEVREALKKMAEEYIGKPVNQDNMSQLEKRIKGELRERRYLAAKIRSKKLNSMGPDFELVLEIENPYRYEILIEGEKKIPELSLYRLLDIGQSIPDGEESPEVFFEEKLREIYLKEGMAHVKINMEEIWNHESRVKKIKYFIDEGPIVKIYKMEVEGQISRPSKYYSQFIIKNSSEAIARNLLNRQDLELGYKNLITELKNQGYLRAKLNSARIQYFNQKTQAIVSIVIDEGPLSQIKKISFVGVQHFSDLELLKATGLKPRKALSLIQIEKSLKTLQDFYFEHGFLEMKILNNSSDLILYDTQGQEAEIQFKIYEGPQLRVGKLELRGNHFTHDSVIINEIEVKEGELITPELISRITNRLNQLGIFSRIEVSTVEANTQVEKRTLVVKVDEDDPGTFRTGLGATSEREFTVRGFIGVSYNNIAGTGRAFSGRLELKNHIRQIDRALHKVTLGYMEPFLFHSRTRGRVNLTQYRNMDDFSNNVISLSESNRLDLLLERQLTEDLNLTWLFWSFDSSKKYKERESPDTGVDLVEIASIGPTLTYEKRDNILNPKKGYQVRWSLKYSSPELGSSDLIQFYKTEFGYTYLYPINKSKWVWANSISSGYVENLSDKPGSGVPESHAFFLGGATSLRGFDSFKSSQRLPPDFEFAALTSGSSENQLIIQNSSNYHLFKTELRFPLNEKYGVGGVLFYDAGTVIVSGLEQSAPSRQSLGFGFSYETPVGPINLQLAWKINPRNDDKVSESPTKFHFSIGNF